MLTAEQNRKSKGPAHRKLGCGEGRAGPAACSSRVAPGKRLVLTSDLPTLTHLVPAQVGPAQGDTTVWEAAISRSSFSTE